MHFLRILTTTAVSTILFLSIVFLMAFGFDLPKQAKSSSILEQPLEQPLGRSSEKNTKAKNKNIAAVALRDHVSSIEKFGTSAFTVPYLKKYYDEVCYLAQSFRGDKKKEFQQCLERLLPQYEAVDIFYSRIVTVFINGFLK